MKDQNVHKNQQATFRIRQIFFSFFTKKKLKFAWKNVRFSKLSQQNFAETPTVGWTGYIQLYILCIFILRIPKWTGSQHTRTCSLCIVEKLNIPRDTVSNKTVAAGTKYS